MSTDDLTAERLREAVEAATQAEHLTRQLEEARQRAAASAQEADAARGRLVEEERDVERLRSFGWTKVLAGLRGTTDDDLRREEAEALDARVAAGHAEQRHQQDAAAVAQLRQRLRSLGDTSAAVQEARAERDAWLREHDAERGPRLTELAEEDGRLDAEQRELVEALDAGRQAEHWLARAEETLRSADGWAAWDTFGGGGLLTDAIKYERIEQVGRELEAAGEALRRFDAELADVHLDAVGALEIGHWDQTFDVWFDNFFSDWQVSRRITDARHRATAALDRVRSTGQRLVAREQEVTRRRTLVGDERQRLVDG